MVDQEILDEMYKQTVTHNSSDRWYPVGVLEWTDDIKNYSEAGTEGVDWIWVKQEDRDVYESAPEDSPFGEKEITPREFARICGNRSIAPAWVN